MNGQQIDSLDTRLSDYDHTATSGLAQPTQWREHLRNWTAFTAAAGASLAVAAGAGAAIIHQTVNQTVNFGDPEFHLSIGSGGGVDAYARAAGGGFFGYSVGLRASTGALAVPYSDSNLQNFAPGAPIKSASFRSGSRAAFFTNDSFGSGGNFSPGVPGFAGVKLDDPMGTHYGWVQLLVNSQKSMTVIDFAWNDVADENITAGDTGATVIPEPSTATMGLLAAGAIGVLAWRRRRLAAGQTA